MIYYNHKEGNKPQKRKGDFTMYNYRQHDLSAETIARLEEADARIDALNAGIREIYRDPKEWYDEEVESLYEALDKAWEAFR